MILYYGFNKTILYYGLNKIILYCGLNKRYSRKTHKLIGFPLAQESLVKYTSYSPN